MAKDAQNIVLEEEVSGQCSFHNRYTHYLDKKKRLTIPSAWRATVGHPKSLHVLPDFNKPCLRVIPGAEWRMRLEGIRQLPISDAKAREFVHQLGKSSDVVVWDTQGRIRVNDELLQFAGLVDQVVLVGAIDTFELWAPESIGDELAINQARLRDAAVSFRF